MQHGLLTADQPNADGPAESGHGFGTGPVFLASISTILGAILFLRFGYAVAHASLGGTVLIILLAHLVTIPTALAVSEIATNRRVAGGGAYYIISRSFGTSIGGAIGIGLYLSQAISIAFYLVAFAEAFEPVYTWIGAKYELIPDSRWVSIPSALVLFAIMLTKGAVLGVSALRLVSVVLGASILVFFLGEGPEAIRPDGISLTDKIEGADSLATVFAVCFPAFTGMIAGLGLSGDLRNPQKSIPLGTISATFAGMLVYALVAVKLAQSAMPDALAADQFIMTKIALWGPSIYIGLAAAALSSALGSILVAPRTLQALARDDVLPLPKLNRLLEKGWGAAREPMNASLVSSAIAIVFVVIGDIDFIAQVLSMFFMVTYGALCTVSFLEYFAGNPSYRPTFHSRWYLSLLGAVMCALIMLRMNPVYAFVSIFLMVAIYIGLRRTRREERGLSAIFQGTMFQLTRWLQITLQKNRVKASEAGWRPSIIAVTRFTERRLGHFDLLRWICHRHGFGHFIQFVQGDYSFATEIEARTQVSNLIERAEVSKAGIFVDSLICPSFRMALAQSLQMHGISGLPNNCVLLEFDQANEEEIDETAQGARMALDSMYNVLILRSSRLRFGYRSSIHLWVSEDNLENAPMMILLAYILVGHPEWRRAEIQLFACFEEKVAEQETSELTRMMAAWRLPISKQNVTSVSCKSEESLEREVNRRSTKADLVIAGLTIDDLSGDSAKRSLQRYSAVNEVLFTHASEQISIE